MDRPNDAIREAIPIGFDTAVSVTLDPVDFDFCAFTIGQAMTV